MSTVDLMAMGDSNTALSEPNNYVIRLYRLIVSSSLFSPNFIGSSNGPVPTWHEGHPGYKITDLNASASVYLSANRPRALLFLAGVNDLNGGFTAEETRDHASDLIDTVTEFDSTIRIYFAKIMPVKVGGVFAGNNEKIVAFNALLPALVDSKIESGANVALVDCHTGYNSSSWFADDIHPDVSGSTFIAEQFYAACTELVHRPTGSVFAVRAPARVLNVNHDRVAGSVFNDSVEQMYLKLGGEASSADFTVKLMPGARYSLPMPAYTGSATARWSSSTGSAFFFDS